MFFLHKSKKSSNFAPANVKKNVVSMAYIVTDDGMLFLEHLFHGSLFYVECGATSQKHGFAFFYRLNRSLY